MQVKDEGGQFRVQTADINQLIRVVSGKRSGVQFNGGYEQLRHILKEGHSPDLLGMTSAQWNKLLAAAELGRRMYIPNPQLEQIIESPHQADAILRPLIAYESVEKFAILILNIKHRVVATEILTIGSETEALVSPRSVFRAILLYGGTRCLIAHNHPSGNTEPSKEDLKLTEQLLTASASMMTPILDHLILSATGFTSVRTVSSLWDQHPQDCEDAPRFADFSS